MVDFEKLKLENNYKITIAKAVEIKGRSAGISEEVATGKLVGINRNTKQLIFLINDFDEREIYYDLIGKKITGIQNIEEA